MAAVPEIYARKGGKGWPKELPCLGYCGKMRKSIGPGDRTCRSCKNKQQTKKASVSPSPRDW